MLCVFPELGGGRLANKTQAVENLNFNLHSLLFYVQQFHILPLIGFWGLALL